MAALWAAQDAQIEQLAAALAEQKHTSKRQAQEIQRLQLQMAQSAVAPDTRYDTDTDFIPDADYNSKILQPDFDSKILQTDDAAKDFKIAAAAPDADSEPDADPDADVSYDFDSPTPLVAGIDPTTSIDPLRDKKRKQRKRINFL